MNRYPVRCDIRRAHRLERIEGVRYRLGAKQLSGIVEHEARLDGELSEPARRRLIAVDVDLPRPAARRVVGEPAEFERRAPADRNRTL